MAKVRKLNNENKNKEQEEYLNDLIKNIPLKKIPKLKFSSIEKYLEEYNKIQEGKSKLCKARQIVVKNVIHNEVRKGTITLKIIENEKEFTKPKLKK